MVMMRVYTIILASLCVSAALLSSVRAEEVGIASRGGVGIASREAVGIVPRSSAATTSVDRGFLDGLRECSGCVSTIEELRAALGGAQPAGDTVVTLCRSTKRTPIVLEGSIFVSGEGANLSLECCGSPAYDPSSAERTAPIEARAARRRAGVVPRLSRKCAIQRATAFSGLNFFLEDGSVSVSSIAFREAEDPINPDFPFGRPVVSVAGVAPRNLVLFNR